jgi:hypothetical protein
MPYQIHQMAQATSQNLELVDAIDFDSLEVNPTISSSHGKHQLSLSEAGLSQPRATIKYDMLIKVSLMQLWKQTKKFQVCRELPRLVLVFTVIYRNMELPRWSSYRLQPRICRRYSKLKLQHFFLQQVSPMSSIYRR